MRSGHPRVLVRPGEVDPSHEDRAAVRVVQEAVTHCRTSGFAAPERERTAPDSPHHEHTYVRAGGGSSTITTAAPERVHGLCSFLSLHGGDTWGSIEVSSASGGAIGGTMAVR